YTPLVHDVDPALFSGSNSDNRSGGIVSGQRRTFVVGKRAAEPASDNNYYSRALQNATSHAFRITCGSDVATGTFRTADWPAGRSYNEQVGPPDPNNPGTPAIPTWNYADRNQTIVDPFTGMLIQHLTFTQQESAGTEDNTFTYAAGTNWTNPANI